MPNSSWLHCIGEPPLPVSIQGDSRLREEVRSLQGKLSEVTNTVIQQGEKMREVRRAKREIDQENTTLKSTLTKTEVRNTREILRHYQHCIVVEKKSMV